MLNKQLVSLLPTAVYALCTGGTPLFDKGLYPLHYVPETLNDVKVYIVVFGLFYAYTYALSHEYC